MKKTKIICTIGPACSDKLTLKKMINAGMNVARFNMSHGTFESHKQLVDAVKEARKELKKPVSILIDTKGPEIRIGEFENGKIELKPNQNFDLVTKNIVGNENKVYVSYAKLPEVVGPKTKILMNDGKIELKVLSCEKNVVHTRVVVGGQLANRKSVNVPSVDLQMPYVSKYDEQTVEFACKMQADYLAISFVRSKNDVLEIRRLLKKYGGENIKIISKIESKKGTENLAEILSVSDGMMVARGDLGVEIDFAKIPIVQKEIIDLCTQNGKLSVVATQMLESMTTGNMPTRAEISDVANSVMDGTCAVMLSGETSIGLHPVLAVETMSKIVEEAEKSGQPNNLSFCNPENLSKADAMAYGTYSLCYSAKADAIVCMYDITADNVSDFSPNSQIFFFTTSKSDYNQSAMLKGVVPILTEKKLSYQKCMNFLIENKYIGKNSVVVTLCNNTIKLEKI